MSNKIKIMDYKPKKYAILSHSGGLDSSTLLLHLLEKGYEVTALSFDYGQKHKVELERATELVNHINLVEKKITEDGDKAPFYPVLHQIIELKGLAPLLNSHLVEGGGEVPEGHYENENMKDTVVPNRNKIFSSIVQSVALSLSNEVKSAVRIALGIHAGDHEIYPDCRQEFRDCDHRAFAVGNWDTSLVTPYTPYLEMDKLGILKDGQKCCKKLWLDFNEVYKRTMTSYKPIYATTHEYGKDGFLCYKWYSDYFSASSVERIEAFIKLGIPDPAEYANEKGPVEWKVAKSHVEKILSEKT